MRQHTGLAILTNVPVEVRIKMSPKGREGSLTEIKRLFQAWDVPQPWQGREADCQG